MFCVIAMFFSLSACSLEKNISPYSFYKNAADNFDGDVVQTVLGKKLDGRASVMSDEYSMKLREALHDIRVNNSRIALPVMICDLPEGFSAQTVSEVPLDSKNFTFFEGDLLFGGEKLAIVYILREKRAEETQGVIVGALLSSADCKWSVGGADSCGIDKLRDNFGEPSASEALVSDGIPDHAYVADNGDFALFISSVSSVMAFSLDCSLLESNKTLCEYAPYDDFDGFSDLAPVSGEPRDFDGAMALGENGIVIGDFSCPADIMVSELGGDIGLAYYGTEPYDESDESMAEYVSDTYILLYKGRYFGIVQSYRKEEQPLSEARMYLWSVYSREDIFCDASLAGIPVSQDIDSIEAVFSNADRRDNGDMGMYSVCKADGSDYFAVYIRNADGRSTLIIQPYFI
ncbi:MAG: hypothetical protein MSJ26_05890 [Oscillospiraceae bacterium]|nr:hypothetical protein [Oscillospiraceae bacterium]